MLTSMRLRILYLLLLVVIGISTVISFNTIVFAQAETATLSGVVTDPQGAVVPGVEVVATRIETGTELTSQTNGAGIYFFTGLMPGHYHLVVRKQGFKEIAIKEVELHVQDKLERNFSLDIGSISETVNVEGGAAMVNTTDASVSTVVDRQFVANIPLNGRSLQSLISLSPGVLVVSNPNGVGGGGEFSVNGQRTEANYFTVDGISANTGSKSTLIGAAGNGGNVASETALGTTQNMISLDALQEFRAVTSTYSAEYGRTPGGQFAFVSRSGTNDWHGAIFDYFRNEALDANNWFNNAAGIRKIPERQNDFGGTLGGPVRIPGLYNGKDKTFFFFSYEGLRLQQPVGAATNQVPDSALRQSAPAALQPFLNAFPVPNGAEVLNAAGQPIGLAFFTAAYSNPASLDASSIRIDHNLGKAMRIFGRYSDSPSSASARRVNLNLAGSSVTSFDVKSVTLGATNTFSPRLFNDFRFNYTHNTGAFSSPLDNFGGAQPFDITQVPGFAGRQFSAFNLGLLFGARPQLNLQTQTDAQHQWNVTDAVGLSHGTQNIKFGIDYRKLSTLLQNRQIAETANFASQNGVLQNTPSTLLAFSDALTTPQPLYTNFSVYAQDEWKATQRLSLSLGLRWDINPAPGNSSGAPPYTLNQVTDLSNAQLVPTGTSLWQTDYHAFAPRVGAAYVLRQSARSETVVRGGFGVFYDTGNAQASAGFFGVGFGGRMTFPGTPAPLTSAQLVVPPASVAPPYSNTVFAFDPHLKLPYTLQWNVAVEQALGASQSLTLTYVGSAGRRLLFTSSLNPSTNPNFATGNGLILTTGAASSDYDALQVQFIRRLSRGLQSLVSYTWSHSIDDGSSNFATQQRVRGNSNFDVRHNFQMALTYDVPGSYSNPVLSALLKSWGVDTRVSARSGLPVDLIGRFGTLPDGESTNLRPNLVPGVPIYLFGAQYPGGQVLNVNAFTAAPANTQGNSPRNFVRDFHTVQADLALRREFPIHERLRLQFRAEAFNIFNHPNFSNIDNRLSDGPYNPTTRSGFGGARSTANNSLGGLNPLYQVGGPRSFQLALKLVF